MPTNKFTLVINAGGESRRMGRSKALLPVPSADGVMGRPLIAHIAERLRPLSPDRLVVVTNDDAIAAQARIAAPVEFVSDLYLGMGALGGIATALEVVDEWAMVVACDMPLVCPRIFALLCEKARLSGLRGGWKAGDGKREGEGERERAFDAIVPEKADRWDVIVPVVGGYAQTFCALYHRRCLPAIEIQLAHEERKITRFFSAVRVCEVLEDEIAPLDPAFRSFMNVNTPDEWTQALAYLSAAE